MAMHVHETIVPGGDPDPKRSEEAMRRMFGPQVVDQQIGQAIATCWMLLPPERKTVSHLETEVRRIVDRALTNLKDDARAFGIEPLSE